VVAEVVRWIEILTQLPVFISAVNLIPNTTSKRLGPSYGPRYISRMILCEIVLKLTIIHRNVVFERFLIAVRGRLLLIFLAFHQYSSLIELFKRRAWHLLLCFNLWI